MTDWREFKRAYESKLDRGEPLTDEEKLRFLALVPEKYWNTDDHFNAAHAVCPDVVQWNTRGNSSAPSTVLSSMVMSDPDLPHGWIFHRGLSTEEPPAA